MLSFKEKLTRTVGEIRYRPTLTSTSEAVAFGKVLEKDFPHWRIENNQNLALFDDKKRIQVRVKHNSVSFVNDGEKSNESFLLGAEERLFKEVIEHSDVSEFAHVGSRKRVVYETNLQKQDLVDLTFKKFYGNPGVLKDMSGDKILDTGFVLDSKKGNFNVHIQIGPANATEAANFYETVDETSLDPEKQYVIFDVDVYKKDSITKGNAFSLLKEAVETCSQITDSYVQFLSN